MVDPMPFSKCDHFLCSRNFYLFSLSPSMWLEAVRNVTLTKTGAPLSETSPMLYDMCTKVNDWAKIEQVEITVVLD